MAKIILVTGGARSGKSSYALQRAESASTRRLFVATCPKVDPEMTERVRRHQQERDGRGWVTMESEIDLAAIFADQAAGYDMIVIDCLTLWINNILFTAEGQGIDVDDQHIGALCREWLEAARHFSGTVICVTNEVGLGIVPDNALGRKYRDLVGTCNQTAGRAADEVILVTCGIPLQIK